MVGIVVFIALELNKEVREKIYTYVQGTVKPMCREGRWVDSTNYHITLKYIGAVKEREVDMLYKILGEIAPQYDAFQLNIGRIGVFGGTKDTLRARVLWLNTVGDVRDLRNLRSAIENCAIRTGFKADKRFSPHITLARDVMLLKNIGDIEELQRININISSVSLMESRVEKGKRVYVPLSVHRLRHG